MKLNVFVCDRISHSLDADLTLSVKNSGRVAGPRAKKLAISLAIDLIPRVNPSHKRLMRQRYNTLSSMT